MCLVIRVQVFGVPELRLGKLLTLPVEDVSKAVSYLQPHSVEENVDVVAPMLKLGPRTGGQKSRLIRNVLTAQSRKVDHRT